MPFRPLVSPEHIYWDTQSASEELCWNVTCACHKGRARRNVAFFRNVALRTAKAKISFRGGFRVRGVQSNTL